MAKVSMRIYLKRLRQAFVKLLIKSIIIAVIFALISLAVSHFTEYSYIKVLRVIGFGIILAGGFSKMGGHNLNNDPTYRLLMVGSKMKNKSRFEQDTLLSNNSFLITCSLSGSMVFVYSILLVKYIL